MHSSRGSKPVCADSLYIHHGGDNFNVIQRELGTLSDDFPIDNNHSGTVVVEAVTAASLLVGIEIDSAVLTCGFSDQVKTDIEFTQRMMGTAAVLSQLSACVLRT